MDWPIDADVPEYFVRGISFNELLSHYKDYQRRGKRHHPTSSFSKTSINVQTPYPQLRRNVVSPYLGKPVLLTAGKENNVCNRPLSLVVKKNERPSALNRTSVGGIQKLATSIQAKLRNQREQQSLQHKSQSVFVSVQNLAYSITAEELRNHFSHLGRVLLSQIDSEEGRPMGQGVVVFGTRKEALLVVDSLQGSTLGGREIQLSILD